MIEEVWSEEDNKSLQEFYIKRNKYQELVNKELKNPTNNIRRARYICLATDYEEKIKTLEEKRKKYNLSKEVSNE